MFGPFDNLFDINRDGKLDILEKSGRAWVISSILEDEDKDDDSDDDDDDY